MLGHLISRYHGIASGVAPSIAPSVAPSVAPGSNIVARLKIALAIMEPVFQLHLDPHPVVATLYMHSRNIDHKYDEER